MSPSAREYLRLTQNSEHFPPNDESARITAVENRIDDAELSQDNLDGRIDDVGLLQDNLDGRRNNLDGRRDHVGLLQDDVDGRMDDVEACIGSCRAAIVYMPNGLDSRRRAIL